MHIFQRKKKK
ncbi:hypothetical protein E2C01_070741 [Portunus trituberculatus]|uniref:Uncharacterized protein n=1 Tax=Portunus trituberculatus TaxID=210409 RepID=A0A5B7HTI3_PORTR|nr:hypothetical protein [Portunus trituberculatus]